MGNIQIQDQSSERGGIQLDGKQNQSASVPNNQGLLALVDKLFAMVAAIVYLGILGLAIAHPNWKMPGRVEEKKPSQAMPALPLQQAYVWQDSHGTTYVGRLAEVAPECLDGIDKLKAWSHGMVKTPKVGSEW